MKLLKDSLTVVLLGDWNKLYMQPEWIAHNIYEKKEIEIGVSGQGIDLKVTYRSNEVVIAPTQSQVTMTAINADSTALNDLVKCLNNFLNKAKTPYLIAYGLNCEFVDDDSSVFANMIDSMADSSIIIENGYEIKSSKVMRSLMKDGVMLNLETTMEGTGVRVHFNEHHGNKLTEMPSITVEQILGFLKAAKEIVIALGYEIEEDD